MKIIGFGHQSRTGKDTAANYICNQFIGSLFQNTPVEYIGLKVSFASRLKVVCCNMFPLLKNENYYNKHPHLRTQKIPEYGLTPVEIWVKVGTSMREIYPDIWINLVRERLKDIQYHRDNIIVVIPDVRAPNEVDFIHEFDEGLCVKIEKPGITDQPGADFDKMLADYEGWDTTIVNDGTLDEFRTKVAGLAHSFIVKGHLDA